MKKTELPLLVVTGSTGQLGGLIVRVLVTFYPSNRIIATTRVPEQADELRALGVQVRWADYEKPESLAEAFVGVGRILVMSSNARAYGEDPVSQHKEVFLAAKKAGAQRIVFTSQMATGESSAFPPMHDYAASEKLLEGCGVPFTILRNGFYGASALQILESALASDQVTTALDGKISWVAHADLAEAAALILAGEAHFEGATPPLTGPEALDFTDLAILASQLLDRKISHNILSDEEMQAPFLAQGISEATIKMVLGLYVGARNNEWSIVDSTLQQLIGRPLITMREQIKGQFAGR